MEQKIVRYFQKMDIEKIRSALDDKFTYQKFSKQVFLEKLNIVFEELKFLGDSELISEEGGCQVCNKNYRGYSFIGNVSKKYIDIIFIFDIDSVKDIFECGDFKNKNNSTKLERVYVDKDVSDDPFS